MLPQAPGRAGRDQWDHHPTGALKRQHSAAARRKFCSRQFAAAAAAPGCSTPWTLDGLADGLPARHFQRRLRAVAARCGEPSSSLPQPGPRGLPPAQAPQMAAAPQHAGGDQEPACAAWRRRVQVASSMGPALPSSHCPQPPASSSRGLRSVSPSLRASDSGSEGGPAGRVSDLQPTPKATPPPPPCLRVANPRGAAAGGGAGGQRRRSKGRESRAGQRPEPGRLT